MNGIATEPVERLGLSGFSAFGEKIISKNKHFTLFALWSYWIAQKE